MPGPPVTSDTLEKVTMTVETTERDSQVLLVPRPSEDPRDPLNWPFSRKLLVTSALCLALFTGMCAPVNGQIQLAQQAKLYGKTTVEITYAVSTALLASMSGVQVISDMHHGRILQHQGVYCRAVGFGGHYLRRLADPRRYCGTTPLDNLVK